MRVLLVDDEAYEMEWVEDLIRGAEHQLVVATNRAAGEARLREHKAGARFDLAIIDVMMAVRSLSELRTWDAAVAAESLRAGLDLIRYGRVDLGISSQDLPILCLTARDDVVKDVEDLDAEYFPRDGSTAFRERLLELLDGAPGSS